MEAKRDEALALIAEHKIVTEKLDEDIDIASQGSTEFYSIANMRKRKVSRNREQDAPHRCACSHPPLTLTRCFFLSGTA